MPAGAVQLFPLGFDGRERATVVVFVLYLPLQLSEPFLYLTVLFLLPQGSFAFLNDNANHVSAVSHSALILAKHPIDGLLIDNHLSLLLPLPTPFLAKHPLDGLLVDYHLSGQSRLLLSAPILAEHLLDGLPVDFLPPGWSDYAGGGHMRLIIVFVTHYNRMSREELSEFTRSEKHHGCSSTLVLEGFLAYARQCCDPLNVYRYMEEKAICTFLPRYWLAKARLHADAGDFRASLECLEEARSRCGIGDDAGGEGEEGESGVEVEAEERGLVEGLKQEMGRSPQRGKRSVDEFELLGSVTKHSVDPQDPLRYEQLLSLYEGKFAGLRQEKDRRERERREGLGQSWMCANYQKEELEEHKIEQKIHENSVKLSREIKYHSMHTPQKERSIMRLNKAMDSVQILKKKRSTNDKKRKQREVEDSENEELMVNSVPVGRRLVQQYNRRVTFVDLLKQKRENEGLNTPKLEERECSLGEEKGKEDRPTSRAKIHKTTSISQPEQTSNTAKTMPDLRSL